MTRCRFIGLILSVLGLFCLAQIGDATFGAALPSQVVSRLAKIDSYMSKVEKALDSGKADHNNLDRAAELLSEIEKGYPDTKNAPEVRAAADRIEKGRSAIARLERSKEEEKNREKQDEQATEQVARDWAAKLSKYKADTTPGTLGHFGAVEMKAEEILAEKAHYDEARAVLEEFRATKIDPESHWELRQAEWDIRVAIENYEQAIGHMIQDAEDTLAIGLDHLKGQEGKDEPILWARFMMERARDYVAAAIAVAPPSEPRISKLKSDLADVEARQAAVEKIVLQRRKMKPDVYKGAGGDAIKSLARQIVQKSTRSGKQESEWPKFEFVRAHIIQPEWNSESATEWTDTTKTAWQFRVTKGINVQVAARVGGEVFLYTVFVHRDRIDGETGDLVGHVMFRDKFLEQNLPKT